MRFSRRTVILGLNAVLGSFIVLGLRASAAPPATAVVASNWKFTPASIDVHVGAPTTLNLTSAEGVHGLASSQLGLAATMIVPGKSVSVTFTPTKAGTYPIHCTVVCGAGHENMVFTVNVLP